MEEKSEKRNRRDDKKPVDRKQLDSQVLLRWVLALIQRFQSFKGQVERD